DHFSSPFDKEAELNALYSVTLSANRDLPNSQHLEPGSTHEMALEWNFAERVCKVSIDGSRRSELLQQRLASEGANYLRLRLLDNEPVRGGLLIESVSATVESNPR